MLVWNAICKNESAIIGRCLNSLLPHVDGAIVADTGSTDGTPDLIRHAFETAGKPVEVHSISFENFSQARNEALRLARASSIDYRYLLFADCDMELVVEKNNWLNGQEGLSYDMEQRSGSLHYFNRRLLSRHADGFYKGVTHEYLDVGSSGAVDGAYFIDHADGANRPDKLARDVAMLEQALATETTPGLVQRYTFYLASSYFDLEQWERASHYYKRRTELGGYAEECWYAQLRFALCLAKMGDKAGFVWEMLKAYEMRPQRAESFYELAKFFRELGDANRRSLLFSEPGMALQRPADMLFINDYVYHTGLKEEFSICAYYSERHRRRGKETINQLALACNGTDWSREQARKNLFWYLQPLKNDVPSFQASRLPFQPPDGWVAMNPSVINRDGKPLILVRTVNYEITDKGQYVSRTGDVAADGIPIIRTRNWLVRLSPAGTIASSFPLRLPEDLPNEFELVQGFEDSRLFECGGKLWTLSTVRQTTREGWCEQALSLLANTADGEVAYDSWFVIHPQERRHEKNWMPWPEDNMLHFVYRLGALVNSSGENFHRDTLSVDVGHISGGSQVIKVEVGGRSHWLALVHEARFIPGQSVRYYQHRFAIWDHHKRFERISQPFFFNDRQIEFAAGLALIDGKLMASYGVRDEEAWIATMDPQEVVNFVYRGELWI
jgi:glycosyltransferase involved in cell wall biosynthesis/predicted GH43/DUF377 family glycosyl hydrolase